MRRQNENAEWRDRRDYEDGLNAQMHKLGFDYIGVLDGGPSYSVPIRGDGMLVFGDWGSVKQFIVKFTRKLS